MKPVTGVVVNKWSYKGLQPMNGKYMAFDFPFRRPILYRIQLEQGCEVDVSQSYYDSVRIGDMVTVECMELIDYTIVVVITALFFLVFIGGIMVLG